MNVNDLNENYFYPAHAYMIEGKSISIAGPLVDFSKVLKKKIKDSRKQSTYENPYILVIDSSWFLGDMKENIRTIQTSFQPNQNTRFSGVLFVKQMHMIKEFKLISSTAAACASFACKSGEILIRIFPEKVFSGSSPLCLHQAR